MTVAVAAVAAAGMVKSHNSFTQFYRTTEMVQTGTVVRWAFNNPHSWLYLNIENEDGSESMWSFEGSGPVSLITRGITGNTFEPGDTLTFMYCPMRDGRNGGHLGWIRLADGSYLNPSDGGCNGNDSNIEQWKAWLEQGYLSNKDAMAAD
jgi:hypothetical protein